MYMCICMYIYIYIHTYMYTQFALRSTTFVASHRCTNTRFVA